MKKSERAPRVEVVSEGPPVRSLAEILKDPPKLELAGVPGMKTNPRVIKPPKTG